jgi:predicted nuclease of predicted toxin-antitoxin system
MVKIWLDECLPKKLKYRIEELAIECRVRTVQDMEWDSSPDGVLLAKAEGEIDVFVTSDRNLSFQQPIKKIGLHVLLLIAHTNTYEDLLPLIDKIEHLIIPKPGHLSKVR